MPKEANLRFSAAWTEAERKARSARALLNEVPGSEGDAVALLREAWSLLERARATLDPARPATLDPVAAVPDTVPDAAVPDAAVSDAAVSDAAVSDAAVPDTVPTATSIRGTTLPALPDELVAVLGAHGGSSALSTEQVHRAADFVDRALGELTRDALGWNRYRRELLVLASTLLGVLVVVAGLRIYDALGPSVWLARVYPGIEFKGNPEHLVLRTLDQDWGRGKVAEAVSASGFSARFDTCLRLGSSTKVRFWLQSKGAANLYVDDRKLITNWNMTDTPNAKGKTTMLDAGSHHVSVDLVNQTGAGILHAQAGFDDDDPAPMDHHWFERPIAWPPETPEKGKAKTSVCAE